MVKRSRKIPRASVEPFLVACDYYSKSGDESAEWYFERFMKLIDKYSDYFFSEPWPKKYDFDVATSFSEYDEEFLFDYGPEEFGDRLTTVCLKKNFYCEGFMGYYGMMWTRDAFHKKFVRPLFEPVLEFFKGLTAETDARKVLDTMLEKYELLLIHDSLIDLIENSYPEKQVRKLIEEMLCAIHDEKKLPNCWHHLCEWYKKQKELERSAYKN